MIRSHPYWALTFTFILYLTLHRQFHQVFHEYTQRHIVRVDLRTSTHDIVQVGIVRRGGIQLGH
jgi:hypothetical protein